MMNQSYVPSTNGLASYAEASPDYELAPIGLGSMREQVEKLAEYGRYGDIYVVHAAEGETVIPMEVLEANPQIKSLLFHQMEEMGLDPERYVVGNDLNSLNPVTGMPEFFFKKIWKAAKKYIIPMAVSVIGNMIAPGIGGLIATAMYTKLSGGSWGDVLKSTALAWGGQALMGGAMSAYQGGMGKFGAGFMAGAKAPLTAGPGLFKGWTGAGLTGATAGQNPLAQGMFSETLGAGTYQGGLYPSYDPQFGEAAVPDPNVIPEGQFGSSTSTLSVKAPVADPAIVAEIAQRNATLAELGQPPLNNIQMNDVITKMHDAAAAASSGPTLGDYSPSGLVLDKGSDVLDMAALSGVAYGAGLFDPDEPPQPKSEDLAGFADRTTAQELIDADPGRYRIGAENLDPYANVASLEMGVPPLAPPPVPTLPFTGPTLPGTGAIGPEEIRSPFTAGTDLNPVYPGVVSPYRFGSYEEVYGAARGGAVNYPKQVGYINGPGTATSDSIPAMLSNGEFVMTKRAVDGAGGPRTMYDLMRNFEMRT